MAVAVNHGKFTPYKLPFQRSGRVGTLNIARNSAYSNGFLILCLRHLNGWVQSSHIHNSQRLCGLIISIGDVSLQLSTPHKSRPCLHYVSSQPLPCNKISSHRIKPRSWYLRNASVSLSLQSTHVANPYIYAAMRIIYTIHETKSFIYSRSFYCLSLSVLSPSLQLCALIGELTSALSSNTEYKPGGRLSLWDRPRFLTLPLSLILVSSCALTSNGFPSVRSFLAGAAASLASSSASFCYFVSQ
jgi:hypothetical protein